MITLNIITLFPSLIEPHLKELPFKRAIEKNLINVNIVDLRKYALDDYGTVDGKPYGGGVGMLLRIEPIYNALLDLFPDFEDNSFDKDNNCIILMSPKGTKYNQSIAKEFSTKKSITIICGRYEGVDSRVEELCTHIISIGDYILSGGELAALVISESITRVLPGVIKDPLAVEIESFEEGNLEYPQYTRPADFKGKKVPEVLISGDHKKIKEWRDSNSLKLDK